MHSEAGTNLKTEHSATCNYVIGIRSPNLAGSAERVGPRSRHNSFAQRRYDLSPVVIDNDGAPLLGLQWLRILQLDLNSLVHTSPRGSLLVHAVITSDALLRLPVGPDASFDDDCSLQVHSVCEQLLETSLLDAS